MTAPEAEGRLAAGPAILKQVRRRIVTAATLGTLLDGADFAVLLIFLVPIAHYFGVSVLTVTLIHATSYIAGIAGGIIFGTIADRRGRRIALSGAVALFSAFTLAAAFSPSIWWLLVLRVLAGIGIGGESGVAFALINETLPGRRGRRGALSGAVQTMFILGNVLALVLFAVTTPLAGPEAWRWAFGVLGICGVLAFAIRFAMPESPQWLQQAQTRHDARPSSREVLGEVLRPPLRKTTIRTALLMTTAFFGAYALITYGPSMWLQSYHLPAGVVAVIGYAGSAAAILGYLLNGALSDWIGRRGAFVVFGVIGTLAYVAFGLTTVTGWGRIEATAYLTSPVFFAFLAAQFGYGYHGSQGVWLSELYPTRVRATAENLVYYVGRGIGAGLAPVAALSLAQAVGADFRLAITLGLVGAAGTALVALTLPETRGRPLAT
jgi:MFS family permease